MARCCDRGCKVSYKICFSYLHESVFHPAEFKPLREVNRATAYCCKLINECGYQKTS